LKIIYLFFILFLTSSIKNYSQQFEYGIKIGIVISDIRMSDMPESHVNVDKPDIWKHDFDSKLGINISAIVGYHLNPKIYLGLEPGYILKGANFDASESKLDLHYWNLPVILKYMISDRMGIYLGPEFSKLINAELNFDGRTIDMDDFYNDIIEISILMGIDYQPVEYLGFGVRYNYGLTKVSQTKWTDELGNIDSICKENNHYILLYATLSI